MADKPPTLPVGQSAGAKMARTIARLRARDGDRCQLCGARIDFTLKRTKWRVSIDHIRPRSSGGRGGDNLQLAHLHCNGRRGSMPLDQWYARLMNVQIWTSPRVSE